jgi:PAS domain S-box-containing protein
MRGNGNRDLIESKEPSRRDEEKLKAIFDSSPNAITVTDLKGMITECNQATLDMHEFSSKEELIGKNALELIAKKDHQRAIENLKKTLKQGTVKNIEYTFLTKDGREFPAELSASVIKDSSGKPTGFVAITRDITERKEAEKIRESEKELRESLHKLDLILSTLEDGIDIVTYDYVIQYQNKFLKDRFGDLTGKKCYVEYMGLKKPCSYCPMKNAIKYKKTFRVEQKGKDGRDYEIISIPLEYSHGRVEALEIVRDITERKMMEERLSALNFYGRTLNTANNLQQVYELTLDAMERTLGFEYAAFLIIDKGNLRVVCQRGYPEPSFVELPLDGTKKGITVKAANTRKTVLVPDTKKDKDYVEGVSGVRSELAVPVETEDKILGVLNVESKKLEAFDEKDATLLQILASHAATAISNLEKRREIEKSSRQLASLMKSSTKMINSTDLHQRLQTVVEAIKELGWRRAVISVRDENMEITSPEDIVTAGLTEEEREFLWKNTSHGQVWQERFGPEYERFKVGEFYYLPWSDPWVRKRFSDSTVPSKLSPEEMVDWDPQDLLYAPLRLANGRIVGVLSIDDPIDGRRPTRESLAPLELFIHQAAVAIENAQLIRSLNIAREQLKADAEQLELKVKERTKKLKESQEQLLKAQRLAAIGELAGMVGHDLRNPLTGIAGAIYYLKSKLGPKMGKKTWEMLELIEKDVEYSNKIINDLLEYSKELQLELTETTLKLVMKEALSLVKIPKNITVLNSTQNEPRIKIDVQKMKRVFVNIIKNAVDAMPEGGKLTITSKKTDGNLEIIFADTGTGMSKEIVEKIWTTLFTTKPKGMGLGLPICKRIVEAHEGSISVESTVGKGTTFTVTIPIRLKLGGEKTWVSMPESLLLTTTKA